MFRDKKKMSDFRRGTCNLISLAGEGWKRKIWGVGSALSVYPYTGEVKNKATMWGGGEEGVSILFMPTRQIQLGIRRRYRSVGSMFERKMRLDVGV